MHPIQPSRNFVSVRLVEISPFVQVAKCGPPRTALPPAGLSSATAALARQPPRLICAISAGTSLLRSTMCTKHRSPRCLSRQPSASENPQPGRQYPSVTCGSPQSRHAEQLVAQPTWSAVPTTGPPPRRACRQAGSPASICEAIASSTTCSRRTPSSAGGGARPGAVGVKSQLENRSP